MLLLIVNGSILNPSPTITFHILQSFCYSRVDRIRLVYCTTRDLVGDKEIICLYYKLSPENGKVRGINSH